MIKINSLSFNLKFYSLNLKGLNFIDDLIYDEIYEGFLNKNTIKTLKNLNFIKIIKTSISNLNEID
jgi:hypothetical protein